MAFEAYKLARKMAQKEKLLKKIESLRVKQDAITDKRKELRAVYEALLQEMKDG